MASNTVSVIGRIIVSAIVIVGFYAGFFAWIWFKVSGDNNEPLTLMVGAMISAFTLVVGFWIGSSAGSSDKDEAARATTEKLVEAVATSSPMAPKPAPPAPTSNPVRWASLSADEQAAVGAASASDPRIAQFMVKAQNGGVSPDELDYLVSKGVVTTARAEEIKKSGVV